MADIGNLLGQSASSLVGGVFQLGASALNYKYNKKLMEQQNQYNIDMWKMNNEYNSPQAQMQRFQAAGLNPNLIYGQGSAGNSSSPPIQHVPEAPKFDKAAAELARAFNIEGIRTMIANRKAAQADADKKRTEADREHDRYLADKEFAGSYIYEPEKGLYRKITLADSPVVYSNPAVMTYLYDRLSNNYRDNNLSSVRRQLMGSQFGLNIANQVYREKAYELLQPQIEMQRYNAKYFPYTFWIGNGSKVLNALPLPKFHFGSPSSVINRSKSYNFNY